MGIKSNNSAASFFDFFSRSGIDAVLPEPLPAGPLYAEDLFSTYLYEGSNSAQTITNEIDLSGEGGMVWLKNRSGAYNHNLYDTVRGVKKAIYSNQDYSEYTENSSIGTFSNNGFAFAGGGDAGFNTSGSNFVSWTFRKCPKFFDVVTYTGTPGSPLTVNHNLGSVPGCIMIKNRDSTNGWAVYHRGANSGSNPQNKKLRLNTADGDADDNWWNYAAPTDTSFQLSGDPSVNAGGNNYVAYLFAHDEQSFGKNGDEAIIKCGHLTGTGSVQSINLGFEPQWVLIKRTDSAEHWIIWDIMRGMIVDQDDRRLYPSVNAAEEQGDDSINPTATGFDTGSILSSGDYIYIAIRRPHKPPETATDVFAVNTESNDNNYSTTGFPVDAAISINRDGSSHTSLIGAKLIGEKVLKTGLTDAESTPLTYQTAYAFMDKFRYAFWGSNTNGFVNYAFKRAPGFFDVTTWNGDGVTGRTVNHNLEVAPEFMLVKRRSGAENWYVYHKQPGATQSAFLNGGAFGSSGAWNNTEPTATNITLLGDNAVNGSGQTYVGFFWATLPGISKVGSYAGTGNDINVDCGFTNGARFVLIKRTDTSGDWYVLDSARGIVAGNDPFMRLNLINGENNNSDNLDPLSSGFTVVAGAPSDINANGGNYIFLAIA